MFGQELRAEEHSVFAQRAPQTAQIRVGEVLVDEVAAHRAARSEDDGARRLAVVALGFAQLAPSALERRLRARHRELGDLRAKLRRAVAHRVVAASVDVEAELEGAERVRTLVRLDLAVVVHFGVGAHSAAAQETSYFGMFLERPRTTNKARNNHMSKNSGRLI